jgi:hypothetical protein
MYAGYKSQLIGFGHRSSFLDAFYQNLNELKQSVGDFDPIGVESAIKRIEETGVPTEFKSHYQEMLPKLDNLDYKTAEETLTKILKTLHDVMGKKS